MDYRRILRLRALALLVALMLGIVGQTATAIAMVEDSHSPMSSMTMPGGCSGCAGTADEISAPVCTLAFCANLLAVPAQLPAGAAPSKAVYPPIAADIGAGITVRPDPGPPKPLHHR